MQEPKMLFIFIILCMPCSFNAWAQSGSEEQSRKIDGYKLIWSDEFNKEVPRTQRTGVLKMASFVMKNFNGTSLIMLGVKMVN